MLGQGTPSARWARRNVSATSAASWVELSATRMRTSPGGLSGVGTSSRWRAWAALAPGAAGSRRATRRDAASRSRPLRRQVRSASTGACWPSAVRNRSGNSMSARTSAPRNA